MIKLRRLFCTVSLLIVTFFLSACSELVLLNPKGPIGLTEEHLMIKALLLMFIIVIPVIILVFVIAYRYRASNTKAKYAPEFGHSVALELFWWSIPIVIIIVLAIITWVSTHQLDPYQKLTEHSNPLDKKSPLVYKKYLQEYLPSNVKDTVPADAVQIDVVALPWRWLFIYPQYHIATINYIEFPAQTPIDFRITSDGWMEEGHDAPMNSFQIPALGGQIYAMAGMQTKLHLIANEVGEYEGRSVSFSGAGFSEMKFVANAVTDAQFKTWVDSVQQKAKQSALTFAGEYHAVSKVPAIHEGKLENGKIVEGPGAHFDLEYAESSPTYCGEAGGTLFECFVVPEAHLFSSILNSYMTMPMAKTSEGAHHAE